MNQENRPPLSDQEIDAHINTHIVELVRLNAIKVSVELGQRKRDEEFAEAQMRWDQLCQPVLDKDASYARIYQEISKQQQLKITQMEEKDKQDQREKEEFLEKQKQEKREQANLDIIKAQSQTITVNRKALRQYSHGWETRLRDHIRNFLLLKDGHILFSKSWVKNEKYILSAPLIFRPAYNIILHPVLKFIDRYFATNQRPSHPGGIFYITGDQGIGKTSLMLILMSTLSDRSLNFHYLKGIKDGLPQDFGHRINSSEEFTFSAYKPVDNVNKLFFIHIHDDSLPPDDLKDNHLYIIFTSPDEYRLPRLEQDTPAPSDQNTPAPSDQNTPAPSDQNTPAPSDQNTPAPSDQNTPAPSDQNTPAPSDQNTPAPSDQNTPAPSDQNTSSLPGQNTSSLPGQDTSSLPNQNTSSLPNQNTSSLPGQNTPTTPDPDEPTRTSPKSSSHSDQPQSDPSGQNTPSPSNKKQPAPSGKKRPAPSAKKKLLHPNLKPGQICHVFRLPTFSLAEDAVVMMGCTPTVPFSLLSPEDMELRKKEQEILLFIEKDKVERARQQPKPSMNEAPTAKEGLVKTLLTALVGGEGDSSTRLISILDPFVAHILAETKTSPFNVCMTSFLNDLVAIIKGPPKPKPPKGENQQPQPQHPTWTSAIETLTDSIKTIDQMPEGNSTTQHFSRLEDKPESVGTIIAWYLGDETDLTPFYKTLSLNIFVKPDLKTDVERVLAFIDLLMNQFNYNSERDKAQASSTKELIRVLVLYDLNSYRFKNRPSQKKQTEALFHLAKSHTSPPLVVRSEIETFSHSVKSLKLTDQVISTDSLTSQLETLKKHFDEPDIFEVANRLNVRDEVERALFVLPGKDILEMYAGIRNNLMRLHAEPSEDMQPEVRLRLIVKSLAQCLLVSPSITTPPKSIESGPDFSKRKMAQIACDLLTMILDHKHQEVKTRLEAVTKEIEVLHNRLSFVLLMDSFFFIAQDMDILVTPHSILKGLSERPERPPADLTLERKQVFCRNVRDIGLSEWVQTATETLLDMMKTPGIVRKTNDEGSTTSETTLEERVLDTVTTSILDNVNGVIIEFFKDQTDPEKPVVRSKWLAILRSMMNTILFLIDAGTSKGYILKKCGDLPKLLKIVDTANSRHLRRVEEYEQPPPDLQREMAELEIGPAVPDDDGEEGGNENDTDSVDAKDTDSIYKKTKKDTDYVNDLNIISKHFGAKDGQTLDGRNCETPIEKNSETNDGEVIVTREEEDTQPRDGKDTQQRKGEVMKTHDGKEIEPREGEEMKSQDVEKIEATQPVFDMESLTKLELPRTHQIGTRSQSRLERMSIALFARNLLWFLEMADDLPFFRTGYVNQFFTEFLQDENPGDVVHRSFVDFMNMTGLLSQRNFGLEWDEFDGRLKNEEAAKESGTYTLQQMIESGFLLTAIDPQTFAKSGYDQIPPAILDTYDPLVNDTQPFRKFLTKKFGVYLLLWASTELLFKAARAASEEPETQKTTSSQKEAHSSLSSGPEKTIKCLNVARASVFGPSPRWLTSTDARTNRGMSFLWDGVLKSEEAKDLTKVADSNHSRIMGFDTENIFFEHILDATWDDITALVPLLPNYKKAEKIPSLVSSVFSLIFKKTQAAIEKMKDQISFIAVSPFVEQIMQSEVVSAIAKLMTHEDYAVFRNAQEAKRFTSLPEFVEEPLVCISFLLDCPTPVKFGIVTTSFHRELVYHGEGHLCDSIPFLESKTIIVSKKPKLWFPHVTNKSVRGSTFPRTLSATKRGETDFYAEDLQKVGGNNLAGLDSLIVSRGSKATSEAIFMPIQASKSPKHSLVPDGIVLIQQLLFQAMCHLESSEEIIAMYNYATTQKKMTFPSQTFGILGFHMVSSFMKFEENTLKHMASILRHRDHPLVTTRTSPHSTMTTREITDTIFADIGHYPTFSTELDPWTTTLSSVNDLTDRYLTLPFRWKAFYDLFWTSSADASGREANPSEITEDQKNAKEWLDRMVRVTMQELNRVGVCPDDLGETEAERVNTFSSFVLSTAISCRRKDIIRSNPTSNPSTDDATFIQHVQSIVGPIEIVILEDIPPSLSDHQLALINPVRVKHLRSLNKLCRQPCIEARLHIVTRVMSNLALKQIGPPAQGCLSVLQSEKDGGVFRVPARNNLSSILHCGTVLLDNITPITLNQTTNQLSHSQLSQSQFSPSSSETPSPAVTLNQTTTQPSTPPPHSPTVSETPPRSKTLRIPLHSFVLAKYGFSDSIPALCELTQDQVKKEVTNVTPAPLRRWHPCRVVIDPSLLPQLITSEDPLSLFTSFIHRLFDNPFIPVTTSLSTAIPDFHYDDGFILNQIGIIVDILSQDKFTKNDKVKNLIQELKPIQTLDNAFSIFSLLPKIRLSLKKITFTPDERQLMQDAIESFEQVRPQPTLFFVKSGSDFFTSQNPPSLGGVDMTIQSHSFPIPFSTGYKETDLREEMKQVFEPLTRLLPNNFPTGRPSIKRVNNEGKQDQRKTSSSKKDAEVRARGIVDSAILRMRETSMTPLFMFVVDEDLADHESLPVSLCLSDKSVGCGMMRQRSLVDILWILFLTRISREVMALPLNTSVSISNLTNSVIPFLTGTLIKNTFIKQLDSPPIDPKNPIKLEDQRLGCDSIIFTRGDPGFVPTILSLLVSRASKSYKGDDTKISSVGLELLVSAYPHVEDETHVILLSHLLMICPAGEVNKSQSDAPSDLQVSTTPTNAPASQTVQSQLDVLVNHPVDMTPSHAPASQAVQSQLDVLVNHPSPEIGLVSLIRWFQLLNSYIDEDTKEERPIEQTIEDHNFSSAKISSNLLRALHIIVEHEGRDAFIIQLFTAIKPLLTVERIPLFFKKAHKDEIDSLKLVTDTHSKTHAKDSPRREFLKKVMNRIVRIRGLVV
ncbi:hypothetical protein BLNAU_7816 [Blattamonas nauphoetae]|uniref:Uncharacterized protein n=1 Tax=Blattamonas nauphoetae TaxID=2049346 RepID=A0ABQ9Y0F5_9EUKA|nr:hypothetical protein BLNAU_7816 [Blattamonas nauphoetae]